ncbi:signal transduction histidine kinase [Maribacter vaceletii]|uniref:Oxygen sensor histidine kinase NreB n=1 Tax=Maribacter vaceletii TaxID=1206816 RepID=A0A495EA28_9FLAO|nr:ATP-binding protein [Maribacter vaceletii]RKR13363.1 signal transduction histidine kinase [Maribacter vaceletii]
MKVTKHPQKNISKYKLLITIGSLCILACTNNKIIKSQNTTTILNDSISSWVSMAKNKTLTTKERLTFLGKAHTANEKILKDSIKIKNLSSISFRYYSLNDSLNFRKTNKETIALSRSINDTITLANSYWDLAGFFNKEAIMDSAFFYYQKASKTFLLRKENKLAARMLLAMANVQESIKDNTGAEINCIKAIEIFKAQEDNKYLSRSYTTLGIIANNLNENKKSISYYQEALEYDKKANNGKVKNFSIINNLGVSNLKNKIYETAISYFNEVLNAPNLFQDNPRLYATALNNLTNANFELNKLDNVEKNYLDVLVLRKKEDNTKGLAATHFYLGGYYLKIKDTIKAKEQVHSSINLSKLSSNNDRLLEALILAAKVEPKKAASYLLQNIQLKDSLEKEERKIRNKFARIRFETDEFIAQNELLQEQKRLWTGIAAGLILLLIAIYVIVTQRNKNQKLKFTQQQQANNQEVFNLMLEQKQKVDEAKREEQKRISEELHDGVLGKMLGARMVLTGLNKKADPEAIEEKVKAIAALKNVEGEVRAISHELNHAAYQKIPNFINSITELLTTLAKNAKIEQEFNFNNTFDWDTLSGDIKINVYRMIQECIHNSIKHAECQKVYVNFDIHKFNFEVTVGDNGKGYEFNKEKKGIGLRNIKSRIEKLNGHFTVDSKLGKGTSFFFNIPISRIKKHEIPA